MSVFFRFVKRISLHHVIKIIAVLLIFLQPLVFFRHFSQKHLLLSVKMEPRSSVELLFHTDGSWQFQGVPVFAEKTTVDFTLPERYDALRLDLGSIANAAVEIREIKLRHGFYEYTLPIDQFYRVFDSPNQIIYFAMSDSGISFQTGGNDSFFVIRDIDHIERRIQPEIVWSVIISYYAILAILLLMFGFSRQIASVCTAIAKNYSCKTNILAHKDDGLDQLTSLRFFAAVMIVVNHSFDHMGIPDVDPGWLTNGVSFFFVLSGFILAYAYRDLSGTKPILNFYKNRIGRIWPLHVLLLLLTIIFLFDDLQMRGNFQNNWLFFTNLFLIHSWIPITEYNFSYNAVSWSISTEFFFYLCFPLILKFKKSCTLIALLVLAGGIAVGNLGLIPPGSNDSVSAISLLYVWPGARMLEFICGMWICDLFFQRKLKFNLIAGTVLELLILAVSILYLCHLPKICSHLEPVWGTGCDQYFSHCGAILLVPLLIYVFACNTGGISKLLQLKPFVLAGEISFSIYLVHQVVIFYVQRHMDYFVRYPLVWRVTLVYAFIFSISFLLWKFFETPVRSYVKRMFKKSEKKSFIIR